MSEFVPADRKPYMPTVEMLTPQGDSRYLARVHQNEEHVTKGGITIVNTEQAQDYPTTGEIVKLSPMFDAEKFPDIKPGMCVKIVRNGWSTFWVDGVQYAVGTAAQVLAVYDPALIS